MGKSNPTLVICPLFLVIFNHTMLNSVQVSNLGGGHLHNFMCEREKKKWYVYLYVRVKETCKLCVCGLCMRNDSTFVC